MAKKLGFTLNEIERCRVVFEGTPDRGVYNPMESVHGSYAATPLATAWRMAVLRLGWPRKPATKTRRCGRR